MWEPNLKITSAANDPTQITAQALIQLLEHYERRIEELEAENEQLRRTDNGKGQTIEQSKQSEDG